MTIYEIYPEEMRYLGVKEKHEHLFNDEGAHNVLGLILCANHLGQHW